MTDLISRQDAWATMTDIMSEIQKVRNSIPNFRASDWELHMSDYDLKRLREVCEYSTNTEDCICGLAIIIDDRAIKPTLIPKIDCIIIRTW